MTGKKCDPSKCCGGKNCKSAAKNKDKNRLRCEKCAKMTVFIANIGHCHDCGCITSSGAFRLCKVCAAESGRCEICCVMRK